MSLQSMAGPPGSPVYTNNKGKKGNHTSKERSDLHNIPKQEVAKYNGTNTAKSIEF